jgi:hypothetical protein
MKYSSVAENRVLPKCERAGSLHLVIVGVLSQYRTEAPIVPQIKLILYRPDKRPRDSAYADTFVKAFITCFFLRVGIYAG